MLISILKRALILSALFFIASFSNATESVDDDCRVSRYHEVVKVKRVTDGDTLVLTDQRKVRLIGINAPERARDGRKAQAFSEQAKRYVESMVMSGKNISIFYGEQSQDRYGRVLAHIFIDNGKNLSALLLEKGYASAIVVPPNDRFASCYFEIEKEAKRFKKNIWSHADTASVEANKITRSQTGFQFIKGKVIRIGRSRNSIWLQLAKNFTVRIKRQDFKYFPTLNLNKLSLSQVENKTLVARGWVYQWKKGLYLQVRHSRMMNFISD